MRKVFNLLFTVVICFSCTSKTEVELEQTNSATQPVTKTEASPNKVTEIRREYWPLDKDVFNEDTTLKANNIYEIRTKNYSLNDSAVVHKAIDDLGELLIHSHNRIAEVNILKNKKQHITTTLTKNLFEQNTELQLTGTSFQKYSNEEFIFRIDACIPDTDVCEAAEVAIDKHGKVKLVRFIQEVDEE